MRLIKEIAFTTIGVAGGMLIAELLKKKLKEMEKTKSQETKK